jgi:hypothetical protein
MTIRRILIFERGREADRRSSSARIVTESHYYYYY